MSSAVNTRAREGNRKLLVLAIILNVIAVLFSGALMFTSGYMISLAATVPFTVLALHIPSLFVRIFGIGKPVIQYFERLMSHDWVLRLTSRLRKSVYDSLERARRRPGLGASLGIFAEEIEHLQNLYIRTVIPQVTLIAVYAIVVILMGIFSPAMGLLMLILLGVICIGLPLLSVALNRLRIEKADNLRRNAYILSTERMMFSGEWRLSGRRSDWSSQMLSICADRAHENMRRKRNLRILGIIREAICVICICMIFLWASAAFSPNAVIEDLSLDSGLLFSYPVRMLGDLTMHDSVPYAANWIAAFVLCAFPLLESFEPLNGSVLGYASHKGSKSALEKFQISSDDYARKKSGYSGVVTWAGHDKEGIKDTSSDSVRVNDADIAVDLNNVIFSYPNMGKRLLDSLDLHVPRGEHIALVGRSGAGKTTLLELIRGRLETVSGSVHTNGRIGVIEQDPYIFHMPLRENLLLANPAASDDRIADALRRVRLDGLLERLPEGLDSVIAEDGIDVSGGERHRLALARVILFNSDTVLLDEPFQGLDQKTSAAIAEEILDILSGKTVIVVTHDLTSLGLFDRVLELRDGRLVPYDPEDPVSSSLTDGI